MQDDPKEIPNKFFFFGTVVLRGKNKSSCNVKWDVLPKSDNFIQNITRSKLIVVADGEEEKAITDDAKLDDVVMVDDEGESPQKKKALGSDEIIDKYLSDTRATYHDTVVKDKIKFFDATAQDPDWLVKQCYLLIIVSATEIVNGVER